MGTCLLSVWWPSLGRTLEILSGGMGREKMTFKGHLLIFPSLGQESPVPLGSVMCVTPESPVFLFVFVGVVSALGHRRPVSPAFLDSTQRHESRPH